MNSKEHGRGLIIRVKTNPITVVNKWEITSILCVQILQHGYACDLNNRDTNMCICVMSFKHIQHNHVHAILEKAT
jgi:hypothetical protein